MRNKDLIGAALAGFVLLLVASTPSNTEAGDLSTCYRIGSGDLENNCIGIVKKDLSTCYRIGSDDLENNCIGIVK